MNARTLRALLLVGIYGSAGVLVDFYDGVAIVTEGPQWLHQLDLFMAIIFTVVVLGLGTYYGGYYRSWLSAEDSGGH
ncbi:MAG: hypothetical protein ABEH81_02050 [Halopenitus sp.]